MRKLSRPHRLRCVLTRAGNACRLSLSSERREDLGDAHTVVPRLLRSAAAFVSYRIRFPGRAAKLAALLVAAVGACGLASDAMAGYVIQPANGSVTAGDPTFLVGLDRFDSIASVHVSSSPQYTSFGSPIGADLGFCSPTTPFNEPEKYTCKPAGYSPGYTSKLPPGTYYWWLTFWRSNPAEGASGIRVSGPFQFTVAAPTAPVAGTAGLVSPRDGATTRLPIKLAVKAPAGSVLHIHAGGSDERLDDGSPLGIDYADCTGTITADGTYTCDLDSDLALEGETYYWWAIIESGGGSWIYGPWTLTVGTAPAANPGSSGSAAAPTRTRAAAPNLPTVQQWRGASSKHARLSSAVYQYSKWIGYPRQVAVACWSDRDWPTVSESATHHTLLGFWSPLQPRWLHLAPQTCRAMQTLLTSRPQYPNVITANALDTVAHEMLHAMGIHNEAMTECFSMQTADVLGWYLGIRGQYLKGLSRLFLAAYKHLLPKYRDPVRCREGGEWDNDPKHPSSPWHP